MKSGILPVAANLAAIDSLLRLIDREVWIVTAQDGTRRGGLTATWISQASLDRERPVLLAGIAPNHFTAELIRASGSFAAHLLLPEQFEIAWSFAAESGRNRDKLAGLATGVVETGSPVLSDCLAWFDCRVFASYDCGDRLMLWGDVVAAGQPGEGNPLREQAFIGRLNDQQRQRLKADREGDIALQRPPREAWRANPPRADEKI
jgi:flavin reductase (DIM6/NTAB) family NADH-FMN oxidoreductase RutF